MMVSVWVEVLDEISFICQKISFKSCFLESSMVATSWAASGSVVILTAYTASTSFQTARLPDISSTS